jgi:predicted alpha/beta superfamily hydrolase
MAMSPSVWVKGGAMIQVARHAPLWPGARIYVDAGGREGYAMQRYAAEIPEILAARGLEGVMWRPEKKGSHNEKAWRRRLPKAMRFLLDGSRR